MTEKTISSKDLWQLVDRAFCLMHPTLNRHHLMVSYLSFHMARAAGLPPLMQHLTLQAAYLHDVGAVLDHGKLTLEDIEDSGYHAAQLSARLLGDFPEFMTLASIIRHCQTPYRHTRQLNLPALTLTGTLAALTDKLPRLPSPAQAANIIHLADAVSLRIDDQKPVLNQVQELLAYARANVGDEFSPHAADALEKLEKEDQVWLDVAYFPERILDDAVEETLVDLDTAMEMAKLISLVIDFRSPFTAMHSAGVAASARALAQLAGMNQQECKMMEIAGNLHDLGKIRTPREILEKPGPLTPEEFNVIKEHAYFTDMLLSHVRGFEVLGRWASLHHEKINGTGYPYQLTGEEIPFGAKLMAVADVFSAITEDRPYRKGMPEEKVKSILRENAEKGALSLPAVQLLIDNYETVNSLRAKASHEAGRRYYRSLHQEEGAEKASQ